MATTISNRTTESLLARRALAEKATSGPWVRERGFLVYGPWGDRPVSGEEGILNPADASHIAANSPDVVMDDIDEILRLRAQVERLEKEADWLAEYCWKKPEAEYHPVREMRGGFYCGTCPHDHDCRKCWREAARKAVEEMK